MEAVPWLQDCQARATYAAPPWRQLTDGGATAFSTRSTRARSRTPTATGSATCAGSSRGWTISSGWGSTASGSTRRCRRRTTTGATTSRTTAPCTRTSARSRPRRARRGLPRARDGGAARPRPEPHERPPRVVRRRAVGPRRPPPRLLRLGRPCAGRRPAEQLAVELRRLGVAAARADRPVLPEQLPAEPAGPQLVERRGPRGVRRGPALLVRARDRGLADRRLPRDRQGPRAARRPRRDRGRPPGGAASSGCGACSR